MLVSHLGRDLQGIGNPVIGCLFTTRRTEARFTGVGDFLLGSAGAAIKMVAQERGSTRKDFDYVLYNCWSHELHVFVVKVEPVIVVKQNVPNFDTT